MTEYQVQTTNVPPVLRLIDGALYVDVIFGEQTFRAPIGSGQYFFSQVVAKLVDPALKAAYPQAKFEPLIKDEPLLGDGSAIKAFLSPND